MPLLSPYFIGTTTASSPHKTPLGNGLTCRAEGKESFTCHPWEEKQKIKLESHVLEVCPKSGTGKYPAHPNHE